MRYCLIVVLLCLGILFYLGMYFAPFDEAVHVDPLRPSTLVRIVAHGARALFAQVRAAGQGLVDAVGNPQRERVKRHFPNEAVHH